MRIFRTIVVTMLLLSSAWANGDSCDADPEEFIGACDNGNAQACKTLNKCYINPCSKGDSHACKMLGRNFIVIGVEKGDTLSVREGSHYKTKKLGDLSYSAINIKILECEKKSKKSTWCKIEHYNIHGWVNRKYLKYYPINQ